MWTFFAVILVMTESFTNKEIACGGLVMDYITEKSDSIHSKFKENKNLDEVGILNKMIKDSFTKCNSTITQSQARSIDSHRLSKDLFHLVEIDIDYYYSIKVEPNLDFITLFKKIPYKPTAKSNDL
jgi:hypothetical protein